MTNAIYVCWALMKYRVNEYLSMFILIIVLLSSVVLVYNFEIVNRNKKRSKASIVISGFSIICYAICVATVLDFLKKGCIQKWLERLMELDKEA